MSWSFHIIHFHQNTLQYLSLLQQKGLNNNHSQFLLKFEEIDYCTVFYSKDLNSPNWIVGSYEKIIFCYFLF